ncbi:dihydroorotase [Brevibacillus borstelensis]|uniref:Dihydroorotase n=1 Tax=Brevibacillus borstelensis AK1 TaxID=1300222 RepID=M8DLC0_9BACL|nr:dihydroorotase [Brevibacillus borstelensis]EMT54443.1 dihydroorotase [Brevibacillus borstelensis AK1]MED1746182.1 dihydroorotase [Brevibacillus borstelensis]MED1854136.1 dihydroorotase [Brevibacillus borstelensis]MED1872708.1 dihydroorotase [Brevibacillus borstelensis]MED1882849.1 dihydroorotase [Brevibacillus borstelensis]
MGIILGNGKLINRTGELIPAEVLVTDGRITAIAEKVDRAGHEWIDCRGGLISAGFIDVHVHLREPGLEQKETIATGANAAVRGGFTTIACMPNTRPSIDSVETVRYIHDKAREAGAARVLPYGAITIRQLGKELTDFSGLKEAGIFALTDDGVGVQSAGMMKKAMQEAAALGLSIVAHCEDDTLLPPGGALHDGVVAARHGLPGIPSESESVHVGRDILLAEQTGVHYHVCHISAKESVRLVRDGKRAGVNVTCEVTPHHLLLCDEDIPEDLNTNWKMNPPLRSRDDRAALIAGLKDGTIDIIATDHAPHTAEEKANGLERAPFGIVGLETAFPLLYTNLVLTGELTLKQLVDFLTVKPADCFQLPYGRLEIGAPADLTVIDLDTEKEVDPDTFASKGKNTPFAGWKCKGWPAVTLVDGKIVYRQA